MADIQGVTLDDLQIVAREMFDPALINLAAIGPFAENAAPLQVDVG